MDKIEISSGLLAPPSEDGRDGPRARPARRRAMLSIGLCVLGLCVIALLGGCASKGPAPVGGWDWVGPVPDGYYLIRRGDTLSEVATRHGVGLRTLAGWNGLESPYSIYAGRLLRVTPPDGSPAPQPSAPRSAPAVVAAPATPERAPQGSGTPKAAERRRKPAPPQPRACPGPGRSRARSRRGSAPATARAKASGSAHVQASR